MSSVFKLVSVTFGLVLISFINANAAIPECKSEVTESYELIYVDQSSGHAVYSYPRNTEDQKGGKIIYVSTAYGPAIYSYPHNDSDDTTTEFNVCYTENFNR